MLKLPCILTHVFGIISSWLGVLGSLQTQTAKFRGCSKVSVPDHDLAVLFERSLGADFERCSNQATPDSPQELAVRKVAA